MSLDPVPEDLVEEDARGAVAEDGWAVVGLLEGGSEHGVDLRAELGRSGQ